MADTSRRRWLVRIALVAVIVLLVYWARPRGGSTPAASPPQEAIARADVPSARWRPPPAQPKHLAPPTGAPLTPIIDEVTVEKPVVCRGEENLISIKAHTPGNVEDAYLSYFVSSETGQSVPLRLHDRSDEERGVQREVIVFGRDGIAVTVPLPDFKIEDCDTPRQLHIDHSLVANTENVFLLHAFVRDIAAAEPMEPTSYVWKFSDGTTAETSAPTIEHDFGARAQDALHSQVLIACTAVDAKGERVMGRKQLQLRNPAFEELTTKGLVRLSTSMDPRFPHLDDDGVVRQTVRVWHHRPDTVRITRVVAVKHFVPGAGGEARQPQAGAFDPVAVLKTASIPAGAGITAQLELDIRGASDLAHIEYYLEGESAEGFAAHGNFALMAPPPAPTREDSQPVLSAYMRAKILRARELLGQELVTDEDIWKLEREGHMADLRPEDFPDPEPAPELVRPPAGKAPEDPR